MINSSEYVQRRISLAKSINKPCLIILDSAPVLKVNDEALNKYRPDSDLLYFTGFSEPNSCFVALVNLVDPINQIKEVKDNPKPEQSTTISCRMFVQSKDQVDEQWHGPREGINGTLLKYQMDSVFDINELYDLLKEWILDHRNQTIYFSSQNENSPAYQVIQDLYDIILTPDKNFFSPKKIMHQLRCQKSQTEINLIRRACEISSQAHLKLINMAKDGMKEYQLEGAFIGDVMSHGCSGLAYPCTIGSGINGTIIHYNHNKGTLREGELVVVDAGGEYQSYAADISRTWPVNGKFNDQQRLLYQIVFETQQECLKMVKPGALFENIQQKAVEIISRGLIEIGLLKGDFDEIIRQDASEPFYMHGIGHWIGIDVHDCPEFHIFNKPFLPGYCLTIEPGVYISPHAKLNSFVDLTTFNKLIGIAVRLEDTVVVTEDGMEVLGTLPKEITFFEKKI